MNQLLELYLNNWDLTQILDMSELFSDCNNLTEINLTNFNTNKVTNMKFMFNNCNEMKTCNLKNFKADVENVSNMFSVTSFSLSNWIK